MKINTEMFLKGTKIKEMIMAVVKYHPVQESGVGELATRYQKHLARKVGFVARASHSTNVSFLSIPRFQSSLYLSRVFWFPRMRRNGFL